MAEPRQRLVLLLCFALVCLGMSCWQEQQQQRRLQIDTRIPRPAIEGWMLEALPGVGPVTRARLQQALMHGEPLADCDWPARSSDYVDQVFRDQASASRNATQQR